MKQEINEKVRLYSLFSSLPTINKDVFIITDRIFKDLKIRFSSECEEKTLQVRHNELFELVYYIVNRTIQQLEKDPVYEDNYPSLDC